MMVALLLGSFFLLICLKVPISFSLLISSLLYLTAADISLIVAVQRMAMGVGDSFPLMAVPFFILAGNIMNSGGITRRIFDFANKIVGHITGGLGHANILASIIFSGMSGTAIADAGGLGAIELKAMKDAGYDEDFSWPSPALPPSSDPSSAQRPAVVFGVIGGVSIGRLFIGGVVPGLIMGWRWPFLYTWRASGKTTRRPSGPRWAKCVLVKESFFTLMTPVIILGESSAACSRRPRRR
jgi:tripartite ATP-independent transporter DctM subunit